MDRTEELIKKLNEILSVDGDKPSVSPTTPGSVAGSTRDTLFITPDLDVEQLSENELLFVHVMLHKLYASKSKSLKRDEIIRLHKKVKPLINHVDFDDLDRK